MDEVESLLKNATYGLSTLNDDLDTLLTRLTATRAGYLDELDFDLDARLGAPAGASISIDVAAIKTVADAVKAKTDNLPSDPADDSDIDAQLIRKVSCMTFWSDVDDSISLPAVAADTNLPDIVINGIPSGSTLVRVVVVLVIRAIENTSASGANAINGAQNIRVKKSTGAWGTDDVIALNLADNQWTVAASTREYGDVKIGDNDVKTEVDGDATYNLRFEDALVDYANLQLNDVQVGLRVWFY